MSFLFRFNVILFRILATCPTIASHILMVITRILANSGSSSLTVLSQARIPRSNFSLLAFSMAESKAKNMLQKLSLTPKRNHEAEGIRPPETEEELLQKLKTLHEEKDYLHLWTVYEKLATMIEERVVDKTKKGESAKQIHYYQSAALALVELWQRDSVLPFEQYFGGDIFYLFNKALDVAVRHTDPSVVHTLACEAGIAMMKIGKSMEARQLFLRGEQHLEAVPFDAHPDFMERLLILYGVMDTLLIEERWNEYMIYADKIWMMTMKEKRDGDRVQLLENVIKEVEQVAVLLRVFQRRVECSERHEKLLASYRIDDWTARITRQDPNESLTSLNAAEQKIFRRFLYYVIFRNPEKCHQMIPPISEIVARPFRIEVFNDHRREKDLRHVAVYSRTAIEFFRHASLNYCALSYLVD